MPSGKAAVPTRWLTVKGEVAYFTSRSPGTDEYVLYVVQVERVYKGVASTSVTLRTLSRGPALGMVDETPVRSASPWLVCIARAIRTTRTGGRSPAPGCVMPPACRC